MACACNKNNPRWEVVTSSGATERIVYSASTESRARSIAKRYPGSTVRRNPPAAQPAGQTTQPAARTAAGRTPPRAAKVSPTTHG